MSDMVKIGRRIVHVLSERGYFALQFCDHVFAAWAASEHLFVPLLNLCLGVCLLQFYSFV